jgi:hypothetical protein
VVVISHYQGDHINGLLMADNSLTWPNAEILVPAKEHAYWMDDGEMSRASAGRVADNFKNVRRVVNPDVLKRVRTYEWGREVVPGLTAPGHTSGTHRTSSPRARMPTTCSRTSRTWPFLFVLHPDWHAFCDQDAVIAQDTQHKVYDAGGGEDARADSVIPFPSLAHIDKNGTGYRYIPVPCNPTI